jgi:hypothetical protein
MTNEPILYPFQEDWERRQAEPLEESGIDWNQRSHLAIDRLPERKQETTEEGDNNDKEI